MALSHAKKLKELSRSRARDLDPEDESAFPNSSEESDSEEIDNGNVATEHYEAVGESKLRKSQGVSLGPQYAGSRIRRDALEEDDEDDPFSREYGDDGSSEDAFDVTEDMGYHVGDKRNRLDHSTEEEDEDDDDGTDITDEDDVDIDDEAEGFSTRINTDHTQSSEQIRKLMADDSKKVAAALSQSAKENVEKGMAVKKQRTTFDTLLNSRIKLQKALVATNSMLAIYPEVMASEAADVVEAAENAAIRLWNNLNDMRVLLAESKTGQKRTHKVFSDAEPLDSFWEEMKLHESAQKKQRLSTLDKWAKSTRSTMALPQARGRLQQPVKEQQLTDVLAGQLSDMSRLVAKTQVPRSCAPMQAAAASKKAPISTNGVNGHAENEIENKALPLYDDADFYTTLLTNLISQRSADSTIQLSNLSLQPWQAAREARTKKIVDTKASKGRKLRYTVHEKLVSFMAPEDRGEWTEGKAEEFFAGLLGRRVDLDEDAAGVDGDEVDRDLEVEGLRLFGGR